ncbi:hypothetical protein MXB_3835 [Myxobolus squamalis]|nr:hypothetical protein MXB_3835 [Myxobolus squamalis]
MFCTQEQKVLYVWYRV